MQRTRVILLCVLILMGVSTTSSYASSTPKKGSSCAPQGKKVVSSGLLYNCKASGNRLTWSTGERCKKIGASIKIGSHKFVCARKNGKLIYKEYIAPAPSLIGGLFEVQSNGNAGLDFIWKSNENGHQNLNRGVSWQTPYDSYFTFLDQWNNTVLSCPSSVGCLDTLYSSKTDGSLSTEISFRQIRHPDQFSYGWLQSADYGSTSDTVIANLIYQPVDGLNSVIYRYDVGTRTKTPIFATYCVVQGYQSCSYGAKIGALRVDHNSGLIYFVLRVGDFSAPTSYVVSIPISSNAITLHHNYEAPNSYFEGQNHADYYSEADQSVELNKVQYSSNGKYLFFRRAPRTDASGSNQICRVNISTSASECALVAPGQYISEIVALNESTVYFEADNSCRSYDFSTRKISPVYVPSSFRGATDFSEVDMD